ncbi:hypothetical protein PS3A_20780 [Pseudomonas sp. 3A(2025)]
MPLPNPEPLCRYHYDPLDRLAGCSSLEQADTYCFYRLNRLATEIQGHIRTSCLRIEDHHLALWQQDANTNKGILVATDAQGSVIHASSTMEQQAFTYMPYGARDPLHTPLHWPGFNGERRDPVTGHYLLGNGYRAFNPVLMRFNSPDSVSPFDKGGLNAYAYCVGDPVNRVDPSGRFFEQLFRGIFGKSKTLYASGQHISEIDQGLYLFSETVVNKKTTYLIGHGGFPPTEGYYPLVSKHFEYSPQQIAHELNVRPSTEFTDEFHLLNCYSGSGRNPFAKQLSALLKKPVVGYKGVVSTTLIQHSFPSSLIWGVTPIEAGMVKTKTAFMIDTHPSLMQRLVGFKYRPVTFANYRRKSLPTSLSLRGYSKRLRRQSMT